MGGGEKRQLCAASEVIVAQRGQVHNYKTRIGRNNDIEIGQYNEHKDSIIYSILLYRRCNSHAAVKNTIR
jgi:hypothetical protein